MAGVKWRSLGEDGNLLFPFTLLPKLPLLTKPAAQASKGGGVDSRRLSVMGESLSWFTPDEMGDDEELLSSSKSTLVGLRYSVCMAFLLLHPLPDSEASFSLELVMKLLLSRLCTQQALLWCWTWLNRCEEDEGCFLRLRDEDEDRLGWRRECGWLWLGLNMLKPKLSEEGEADGLR